MAAAEAMAGAVDAVGFRAAADRATRRGGPTVRQLRKNLRRVVGAAGPDEELDALVGEAMRVLELQT